MANTNKTAVGVFVAIICAIAVWAVVVFNKNSERGLLKSASSSSELSGYVEYFSKFPNGKLYNEASESLFRYCINLEPDQIQKINEIKSKSAIKNTPIAAVIDSAATVVARKGYQQAEEMNSIVGWQNFISNTPKEYQLDAESRLVQIAYNDAVAKNTIDGWKSFKQIAGFQYYATAEKKIEEIENKQWRNESIAWSLAQQENTVSSYEKYLKFHPSGVHASKARKIKIDKEVDGIFAGEHGTLPSMDKSYYGYSSTSSISVHNGTGYTLNIYYSGTTSKKVVIPAGQTSNFSLPNGDYRVAASVSGASVRSYAGYETLSGGGYEASYYISTTRF